MQHLNVGDRNERNKETYDICRISCNWINSSILYRADSRYRKQIITNAHPHTSMRCCMRVEIRTFGWICHTTVKKFTFYNAKLSKGNRNGF